MLTIDNISFTLQAYISSLLMQEIPVREKLIVMLTNNDKTVANAKDLYRKVADLPVQCWGFKDVGLSREDMAALVELMRADGKDTFLEIVSLSENECMDGARIAVECQFDYLMGTVYYESVHNYLSSSGRKFFPFCGSIEGHPSVLKGSVDEIVNDAKRLEKLGVQGIDLLAYRHNAHPEELCRRIVNELNIPVVIAGSIGSCERINKMKEIKPFGFTIGTALFDGAFSDSKSFRDQLKAVIDFMN